ncbi:MAG: DUF3810 domain-containing protein [Clostridia bacterium]|nr:DUF3810 domain-containing protein [Clostridia bacterium]
MRFIREYDRKPVSLFAKISLVVFVIALALLYFCRRFTDFADLMNKTVAFALRRVMAAFGDLFPFSLFELLVFLSPIILISVIVLAVRVFKRGEGRVRFVLNFLSAVLLVYSLSVLMMSLSYNTTTVDKEIGFEVVEVTEDNLAASMEALRDEVNTLVNYVPVSSEGITDPGYSMDEISESICKSYSEISKQYGFVPDFNSRAKGLGPWSYGMSYLGISGIYTFFTGESNVNMLYPAYDVVFTAAHELSHQRGILRENEANFMAYFVCSRSDDLYLRYSAALNMYQYIASALYRTNKERYNEIASGLDKRAIADIYYSSEVSQKYGDTFLEAISEFFNDLFLKSNGTDGVITYGRVVTLAVSYLESQK